MVFVASGFSPALLLAVSPFSIGASVVFVVEGLMLLGSIVLAGDSLLATVLQLTTPFGPSTVCSAIALTGPGIASENGWNKGKKILWGNVCLIYL